MNTSITKRCRNASSCSAVLFDRSSVVWLDHSPSKKLFCRPPVRPCLVRFFNDVCRFLDTRCHPFPASTVDALDRDSSYMGMTSKQTYSQNETIPVVVLVTNNSSAHQHVRLQQQLPARCTPSQASISTATSVAYRIRRPSRSRRTRPRSSASRTIRASTRSRSARTP